MNVVKPIITSIWHERYLRARRDILALIRLVDDADKEGVWTPNVMAKATELKARYTKNGQRP